MTTDEATAFDAGKAIYQLVIEAMHEDRQDQRAEVRFPLFRPVMVSLANGQSYSAFSREISTSGMGLIHNYELPPSEVELSICSEEGYSVKVRTQIIWCRACGEGWYISGGRFVGKAVVHA